MSSVTLAAERGPLAAAELQVQRFAPVSLDTLVNEAELLSRVDRKYLLPLDEAARLIAGLDDRTRVLEISGKRDFAYDSVYFDTPDHLAYRLTAQRRRRRFKLRTRSYLDTGGCFFEVKTKSGRGLTVKQRIDYDPANRMRLTHVAHDYLLQTLDGAGHDSAALGQLQPVLVSRYRRITMLLAEGSRVTIDTDLHWTDRAGRVVALPRQAIIETKSAGRVSALDRALWRAGHRPSGISKFGTGMAALHPELPSNKWARVLRHSFAEAHASDYQTSHTKETS